MANHNIRRKIFSKLSFPEKIAKANTNDIELYKSIVDDIKDMWIFIFTPIALWHSDITGEDMEIKLIKGKNEDELLWDIFNSDYFLESLGATDELYAEIYPDEEIVSRVDKLHSMNSAELRAILQEKYNKEEIIKLMKKETIYDHVIILEKFLK